MPGRGCVDQIFSLQQVVEKVTGLGKKVFCAFVDLAKAYVWLNFHQIEKIVLTQPGTHTILRGKPI